MGRLPSAACSEDRHRCTKFKRLARRQLAFGRGHEVCAHGLRGGLSEVVSRFSQRKPFIATFKPNDAQHNHSAAQTAQAAWLCKGLSSCQWRCPPESTTFGNNIHTGILLNGGNAAGAMLQNSVHGLRKVVAARIVIIPLSTSQKRTVLQLAMSSGVMLTSFMLSRGVMIRHVAQCALTPGCHTGVWSYASTSRPSFCHYGQA